MADVEIGERSSVWPSAALRGDIEPIRVGAETNIQEGAVVHTDHGYPTIIGNRVTVGRNGVVAANINAREIVVLGKVRGNLTASDRVDIRSDGSLTGDVIAARISIEDGAYFKGGIDIRKGGQPTQKANGEDKSIPTPEPAAVGARA